MEDEQPTTVDHGNTSSPCSLEGAPPVAAALPSSSCEELGPEAAGTKHEASIWSIPADRNQAARSIPVQVTSIESLRKEYPESFKINKGKIICCQTW